MANSSKRFLISSTLGLGADEIINIVSNYDFEIEKTNFHTIYRSLHFIRAKYQKEMDRMSIAIGHEVEEQSEAIYDNLFNEIFLDSLNSERSKKIILDKGTSILEKIDHQILKNKISYLIIYTHPIFLSLRIWGQMSTLYKNTKDQKYIDAISHNGRLNINKYCLNYSKSWINSFEKIYSNFAKNRNVLFVQYDEFDLEKIYNFFELIGDYANNPSETKSQHQIFANENLLLKSLSNKTIITIDKKLRERIPLKFTEIFEY